MIGFAPIFFYSVCVPGLKNEPPYVIGDYKEVECQLPEQGINGILDQLREPSSKGMVQFLLAKGARSRLDQ